MGVTRAVVVSDSHLSAREPTSGRNWSAVVDHVAEHAPDVVVHVGDLSLDGTHHPEDLDFAREQLDRLSAPSVSIPGNHDIGDNPGTCEPAHAVTPERLQRWRDVIGPDRWAHDVGAWRLVGLNAQLFGSALAAEHEQWDWLEQTLAGMSSRRDVLVTHKPLAATPDELAAAPPYRFAPAGARDRVLLLLAPGPGPLILSGHVHQYRVLDVDGRTHAWAPTTWAVLSESLQPSVGIKRCGVLDVRLHDDGVAAHELVEPAGMEQFSTDDIPNPYGH